MGFFDIGDPQAAASDISRGYQQGYSQLSDLFNQGRGSLTGNINAGLAPATSNFNLNLGGANAYADATGVNGPQGYAAALQRFQTAPGFDKALDLASQNILRNAGATGGTNNGATREALGDISAKMMYQNWNNYIQQLQPFLGGAQNSAGQILQGKTALGTNLNQSFDTQGNAAYGTQAGIANAQANADNATGPGWGIVGGIGSAFAKGLGMSLSDWLAKADVEPVGELYDGQPIYRYRYKGDNRTQIGLIAQEVEARDPDAVAEIGGLKHVHYGRATNFAADLGRFLRA